jgi:Flp pilus assembly protein TadG
MTTSRQKLLSGRMAIRQALRRLLFEEDGAALVEATIFAPILVAMGVYTADFGLLFYAKMQMQNAAQAGAQWAVANRVYNCSSISTAAQNATQVSAVTVTSYQFCSCSIDSSGNANLTDPNSTTCTVAACTSAPGSPCNTSGVLGNYVTVKAAPTTAYHALVPFRLITSGAYDTSARTTVRIQ